MKLSELRYIVALARARHFGRAAAACFVSQPTLSVAVKKLEEELGVALFERGTHEVQVTPVGKQVVEQAQRALEAVESVRRIAESEGDQLTGALRIGAIYTVGPYLFPDLISNLRERAPRMPLIIEESYTAVLSEKLKHGELDVIIICLPFKEPNILTLPLYEEPFVVLLPAAHPLTARDLLSTRNLAQEPVLMLGTGHCFHDQVLQACPECTPRAGTSEHAIYTGEGGSLETIRHMVASGMGLSVFPCTAAGADRYSQRLLAIRRFVAPEPYRQVALAWRLSFPRPRVIDILQQAITASTLSCVKMLHQRDINEG